jgi:ubiquinone/menaquinone biosynthesis C-methylase UbiE
MSTNTALLFDGSKFVGEVSRMSETNNDARNSMKVLHSLYPEMEAGGFCRNDHMVAFYSRVRALLNPSMTVLEFGAGRGKWSEKLEGYKKRLVNLKGSCECVVGTDVDSAVMQNPMVDMASIFKIGEPLPFEDEQFDMVVSWAVFEHVADAEYYASELARVVKVGGWICAWTPNKWGYVGIGARLVPDKWQVHLLKFFIPEKKEVDSFPTVYKMNTMTDLDNLFPNDLFRNCSYVFTGPPAYHANRVWLARLWTVYNWFMPAAFGQALHIFLQKRY